MQEPMLQVKDLSISFYRYTSGLERSELSVISNFTLDLCPGEIVAVAGSSGSGKSLLAHAIMGLLPENAEIRGDIFYRGGLLTQKEKEKLRGKELALVPQSISYLDPLMRIGAQVRGTRRNSKKAAAQREIFERFHLEQKIEAFYPFQLSGGMARRVLVSTAVLSGAQVILADEPTPGLDLELALEALNIFRELADEGKAVLLITHDIDLAFHAADRVAVFYAGAIVEIAKAADFLAGRDALRHPYSKALWSALPQNGFQPIPGFQPYGKQLPKGCPFSLRCMEKTQECENEIPMTEVRGGYVRCIHAD